MCVRYNFWKFKFLYLRKYSADRYSADRDEVWCLPKTDGALSLISLSWKSIGRLEFYDDFNFSKNVTAVAAENFKQSS